MHRYISIPNIFSNGGQKFQSLNNSLMILNLVYGESGLHLNRLPVHDPWLLISILECIYQDIYLDIGLPFSRELMHYRVMKKIASEIELHLES